MLDILLSRLREEIAIDGEEGTKLTGVWIYISNIIIDLTKSICQKEPTMDDNYKSFLWPHLIAIDSVDFYSANLKHTAKTKAQSQSTIPKPKKKLKATQIDADMDIVSEKDESNTESQAEYTPIDVQNITYQQLIEEYGDNIYAIASKELQEKQLYKNVPPVTISSANQLKVMKAILRERSTGLYQHELPNILNVDQKAAGHYLKSLEERGAIFRIPVSLKSIHTNLCFHVQFKNQHEAKSSITNDQKPYNVNSKGEFITTDDILKAIFDISKDETSKVLIARDILYVLGFESNSDAVKKWFNRSIGELAIKGYIKRGHTKVDNKGRAVTCIEVLDNHLDNTTKEPHDFMHISYPLTVEGAQSNQSGTCIDTNLMQQLFKSIEQSGVNGLSPKEFGVASNSDAKRMITKMLERLLDNFSENYPSLAIKRHFEFQGRRRQFRYFTLQNYNTLVEKKCTDLIPFPEMEWDEAKLQEMDTLNSVIRTRLFLKDTWPEFVSSYYKNLLATKRGKRGMDDGTHSDDASAEVANKPKGIGRPKKKRDEEESDVVVEEPKRVGRPKTKREDSETQPTRTSKRIRKNTEKKIVKKMGKGTNSDDEDMYPNIPILNKELITTTRRTRSQLRSEIALEKESASSEAVITPRSDISINVETPVLLGAPVDDHTTAEATNSSQTKHTEIEKSPAKKHESPHVDKQKSTTQKRTLVDYFGKATKKSKITQPLTKSNTEIASLTDTMSLDESRPTINTVNNPMEEVQVGAKSNDGAEVCDHDIIVAEAAPSFVKRLQSTQKPSTEVSKAISSTDLPNNHIIPASTDSSSAPVSNPIHVNTIANHTTTNTNDSANADSNIASTPIPPRKRGNVNSYSELRKTVLLDVVEKDQVVEVGKEMRERFEEAHERIVGKKVTGTVCLKTLWKTCLELGKNGDAQTKVIDCTMLNGKKITRKVLIRKDIDLDGEEFKEKIELIRTTRAVMRPINQTIQFETYDAPVERLQDRLNRMKEKVLEKSDISQPEASKIVAKLSEYETNASNSVTGQIFFKHGRDTEPRRSFWMITSISHGWLYGRMLRVKCLYRYLCDLLGKQVCIQGVDKEKRTLSLHSIVYHMPCSVFIQIICVVHWTEELKDYVDNPENADTTYDDFPPNIREQLFAYNNKFARTLRKLMTVLIFLGLVIPRGVNSDQDQESVFSEVYELSTSVELWDFRLKPEFTSKETYSMEIEEGIFNYWRILQYIAVQPPPEDKSMLATWDNASDKEIIKSLYIMRNWDTLTIFTKEQRATMSKYINKYKNYTPVNNISLCRKIAEEAGCTVNSIRAYYSKVQDMMDLKKADRNRKRVLRDAHGDSFIVRRRKTNREIKPNGSTRIISRQTKHIFGSKEKRLLTPSKLVQNDTKNLEMDNPSYLDNMDSVPTLDDQADLTFKRTKRCSWNKQKDDLLIYSYVILRQRADKSRFLWYPIKQVIPEAQGGGCKNRLSKLLLNPFNQEYLSKCKILWKTAYVEGLKSGEIQDDDPANSLNFDLISHLEYFLKRIDADLNSVQKVPPLPASISLLHDNYDLGNSSFYSNAFYEVEYHKKVTLISRMQNMYSQCYSIRTVLDEVLDYPTSALAEEDDLETRKVKLIMMLCMMILFTSQELYDPYLAYKMLGVFNQELVNRALSNLKNIGSTITTRISRVIPGTKFSISSKFLNKMADIYPRNMFEQSGEYEKYLAQAGRNQINPSTLSSGMMACVTDLFSINKIHFTMASHREQRNRLEFANAVRLLDRELIKYDLYVKANLELNQTRPVDPIQEPYFYPLETSIFDRVLSRILSPCTKDQRQLIKDIVAFLHERGSLGSVGSELRDYFKSYKEDEIHDCLERLIHSDPPLLCLVGTNIERYVLTISRYINSWTILKDASTNSKSIEVPLFQNLIAIRPSLWTDINGDTTEVIFRDCCRTIIGWIMNKPGITAAALHRFLSNFMNRVELSRILKWLVDQKAIKSVSVCQKSNGKIGLFEKTRLSRVVKSPQFKRNIETSYWVLPGYYNKLPI
ncbi:hypothetical protein K501DRAFT_240304 [Backusella circina FSU 941]|nr:hypothetical protein K501DRAFT_240304 [Backusella circina FSU 941]